MSATVVEHRVTLKPAWVPDPRTSKLLGTRARRIGSWGAFCTCGMELTGRSWSDARYWGALHRKAEHG